MRLRGWMFLLLAGVTAALAACGGDDEETPPPAETPTLTQPPLGQTPEGPVPPSAVVPGTPPTPDPVVPELPPAPVDAPPPVAPAPAATPPAATPGPAAAAPTPTLTAASADPAANADLIARIAAADPIAGADLARQCLDCHTADEGGRTIIGPNLFGVVGRPVGSTSPFAYSPAMLTLHDAGATWTYERLDAFLTSPAIAVPGTRMGFAGISDPQTRANIIAWLRLQATTPVPLQEAAAAPAPAAPGGPDLAAADRPTFRAIEADRGLEHFGRIGCGDCHGPTGGGGPDAPALKGPEFQARWDGRNLYEF
ncbi:MAG: cytochrome c family protein, partial [Bauldia sp.]